MHEAGWGRESVPHFDQYERDMREDWIRPDDYPDDHFMPEGPYGNEPHPPSMPYGPRARGRSFAQERRANPAPAGYSHPSAAQASPRGPGHAPLDSANRRHSQHDRRFSGGPGYSGDGRPFVSNNPQRRQFQHGRGSFNDPNHLQSRSAKLVPRDQLLVANTSIKVEDNDGHPVTTPTPVPITSSSPDKGASTGKRARTDSVAADAEPASRRPSPFASSGATVAEAASAVPSQTQSSATLPAQKKPLVTEPPTNAQVEADVSVPPETLSGQEQRVYAEPNDVSEPANEVESSAPAPTQSDIPMEPAKETTMGDASAVVGTSIQGATAGETVPDMEPTASVLSRPLADVNTNAPTLAADASATNAGAGDVQQEVIYADPQLPLLQFEYLELSDDDNDDNKENAPPSTLRDAIPLRRPDLNKLALDVESVLQANLKLAPPSTDPLPATEPDHPILDVFAMPPPTDQHELSELLCRDFAERETYVESKVDALEDEYLTLNDKWSQHCLKLDRLAEQRRVRDAAAATMAALNVVSEPVAAQTRSTRRNPIVNAGVMADAVHSDMEMEKVMNNMRDAAAVDPDLLARPNLARIPDMVTVMEPEMLRFTFVDENGQVDDPLEFYDFRGRAAEHWTAEERDIFIDQHRVFNKRFDKIAEHLPYKTTSQCVKYYYLMKKVPAFRAQVKRGQRRRLGRGGHQGKASALMADIEKEEDGTGRDDEFIATRRSRRHAAAASYATAAASTPPPASAATEAPKPRRSRVVELARADSYETDRGVGTGTNTPMSFASDSDVDVEVPHPSDLDNLLSSQPQRKGGPGRGRRWAYKGEVANGSGGSVRLDGAEPSKKRPATTSYWTVAERTRMKQNLLRHGRDWNQIAEALQTKTAIQAKNYYFNNQKEMAVFVRAWEKEQVKGEGSAKGSETSASASASASPASATRKEEPKRTTGPVTIQPAPGQTSANANAGSTSASGSGRGNAHYPNVIPQGYVVKLPDAWFVKPGDPLPLLPYPTGAAPGTKTARDKALAQPATIPTPPLPLPGPTFRAWSASAAPPPPPIGYAFGSFPGVAGPSVIKNGPLPGPSPNVPRPNTNAKAGASGSAPRVNPAVGAPRAGPVPGPGASAVAAAGTGGVQRGNPNHYPGPMRYQPYPVTAASANAGGIGKGKAPAPHVVPQKSVTSPAVKPAGAVGSGVVTGGSPKGSLPRTSSGQFASWTGEGKGKKQA
ncbi:hypothetical protein BDV93DRAFT_518235 [Ceratobasidium sp. AG-I]|nr:hypothetical protein BDV93DRAFT_518235 [Ceratobasidium sp. AG-I]